jgi:Ion channel
MIFAVDSFNERLKIQFLQTILNIVSMMFMSAGIMMMFEEVMPNRSYYLNGAFTRMDYLKAVYFMVVTMSTLGYGDYVNVLIN